jgi:CRP/FNR family transcriptional regulator
MTQIQQSDMTTFLGTTFLFKGLSPEDLAQLAGIARLLRYDKGEILFWQAEEGTGFFIVKSGRVKVYQASPEGKEQILSRN